MTMKPNAQPDQSKSCRPAGSRRVLLFIQVSAAVIGLLSMGTLATILLSSRSSQNHTSTQAQATSDDSLPKVLKFSQPPLASPKLSTADQSRPVYSPFQLPPTAGTPEMVDKLVNLEWMGGMLTEEQAATWKQT